MGGREGTKQRHAVAMALHGDALGINALSIL